MASRSAAALCILVQQHLPAFATAWGGRAGQRLVVRVGRMTLI
ncbi:hypothetical protein ACQP00_20480 [Dactylosporangium sp. CS-047395]